MSPEAELSQTNHKEGKDRYIAEYVVLVSFVIALLINGYRHRDVNLFQTLGNVSMTYGINPQKRDTK